MYRRPPLIGKIQLNSWARESENMSIDALLVDEAVAENALVWRLYNWSSPWVTLGIHQRAQEVLAHSGVSWQQRPTGGAAVLHGHDLTLSVAAPLFRIGCDSKSVIKAYRTLMAPVINALNWSGMTCALAADTHFARRDQAHDCFDRVSPNDVVDVKSGVKVLGSALVLTKVGVLAQMSIPIEDPIRPPSEFINCALSKKVAPWNSAQFPQFLDSSLIGFCNDLLN